ncbi:MAG TPA: AtpZ/AtpI family protein [Chloroflexota bacterium]|nr:AtpZ/AtpI family protein [Chloroflexota bacterium]
MSDPHPREEPPFVREIRRRAERSARAKRLGFWRGLGVIGVVGWTVALPAVGGAELGRWLDERTAMKPFSWTLCLLLLGLALGCFAAWRQVERATRA